MKKLILLNLFFVSPAFPIEDSSFKNLDKYQSLTIPSIGNFLEFKINATFYPPEGKKLNHASYIKIWEKKNKTWEVSSQINPDDDLGILSEYKLDRKVHLQSLKSDVAIEVEFIHCNLSGGQCAMERFLGKIKRNKSLSKKDVNLTLRVD